MLNITRINDIDPFAFIGKNVAAYIQAESLHSKIAAVARAVFLGMVLFGGFYSLTVPLPLSPVGMLIGVSLLFLFNEVMYKGYYIRKLYV